MDFDVMNYTALRTINRVSAITETVGSASSANSTWVTLVSMTGSGWLFAIRCGWNVNASGAQFRITIDGGTPLTIPTTNILPRLDTSASGPFVMFPISRSRFESSVLIEYMQTSATSYAGDASVIWGAH